MRMVMQGKAAKQVHARMAQLGPPAKSPSVESLLARLLLGFHGKKDGQTPKSVVFRTPRLSGLGADIVGAQGGTGTHRAKEKAARW